MKILFVCYGNICRSPLAEGVLRNKAVKAGLDIEFDSAATSNWHTGEKPDKRGIKTAALHGIDISEHKARQVKISDFDVFDIIVAMDKSNYSDLMNMSRNSNDSKKIKLFLNLAYPNCNADVHDPYYDGKFGEVFDVLNDAGDIIIDNIKHKL